MDGFRTLAGVLGELLEMPRAQRWQALPRLCPDPTVREEVERLLRAYERDPDFLEEPPHALADAALSVPEPQPEPQFRSGEILAARFRLGRCLGRGGMGEVYEADDLQGGTRVALKVIRSTTITDSAADRFRAELTLGRSVTHVNVCRTFDLHYAVIDGRGILFITMELLEGQTLRQRLQQGGSLHPREALAVARQVAAGLAAAHQVGVIHGDLKPSNIMLVPQSTGARAVIMDFGVAATEQSALSNRELRIGTPAYMAPEQEHGEIQFASDVFAFGAVMFEALTGTRLRDLDPTSARAQIRSVGVPHWFSSCIVRCLDPNPARRYSSGSEVVRALAGPRRMPLAVSVAAITVVGLLCAVWLWSSRGPGEARPKMSVAVLGFQNSTGGSQWNYLSTMLSLGLDAALMQSGSVQVISPADVARSEKELRLARVASFSMDDLRRLGDDLGSDMIVHGWYAMTDTAGQLRLVAQVETSAGGRTVAQVEETGTEDDIPALVQRVGSRIQRSLGIVEATDMKDVRASFPGSLSGMRFYAEGVQQLRSFNALAAKDSLEQAVIADPEFPQAHAALSEALEQLGYLERAKEEAARAFEIRHTLPLQQQLLIEAQYFESLGEPEKAADAYERLLRLSPANPDYLLLLVHVQRGKEALRTIDSLRKLRATLRGDPRIDLAEAEAAGPNRADEYDRALAASRRAAQKATRAGALLLAAKARLIEGRVSWILGHPEEARAAYDSARMSFQSAGDHRGAGQAEAGLALVAQYGGDITTGKALYEQALSDFRSVGSNLDIAAALNGLGFLGGKTGHLSEALHYYGAALKICQEVKDAACLGKELNNLGDVLYRVGDFRTAIHDLEEALNAYARAQGQYGRSFVFASMGDLFEAQGNLREAEKRLEESLQLSRQLHDHNNAATTEVSLSLVLLDEGRTEEALRICQNAVFQQDRLGQYDSAARSRVYLARILLAAGSPASAEAELRSALPVLKRAGLVDIVGLGEAFLSHALALNGKPQESRESLERAYDYIEHTENLWAHTLAMIAVANAEASLHQTARAKALLTKARDTALSKGFAMLAKQASS